jgi:hypothetical protein
MRTVLFLAIAANSLDLLATTLGIHWLGNREGNPLLAGMTRDHWTAFVAFKGVLVPLLIWRLYSLRDRSPVLARAGLAIVTVTLTIAVGQWLGWMAGVIRMSNVPRL